MDKTERAALRALAEAELHDDLGAHWQEGGDVSPNAVARARKSNPILALLSALDASEAERDAAIARAEAAEKLLRQCRSEFDAMPRSLGYDYTIMREIDAHLAEKING